MHTLEDTTGGQEPVSTPGLASITLAGHPPDVEAEPPLHASLTSSLQAAAAQRSALGELLGQIAAHADQLGKPERAAWLRNSREALESDVFRLMVIGEFKRGKSTLVNALLGGDVLPARLAPCTALITELKHAPSPGAILHPADKSYPPQIVPIDDLDDYLVIPEEADSTLGEVPASPWSHVEVFHPLPLLENGVEIIDSPGLNEHNVRSEIALSYLPKADAMLVVLSCEQALSQSELDFLDQALPAGGVDNLFFLWNRYDLVEGSPEDVADLEERTRKHLEPLLSASRRVFYLSARQALQGRKAGDDAALEASGLPDVEAALSRFLSRDRTRVKLTSPLRGAEQAVWDLVGRAIPEQERLRLMPVHELRRRYESQQPRLMNLQKLQAQILQVVQSRQDTTTRAIQSAYTQFVDRLGHSLGAVAASTDLSLLSVLARSAQARKQVADRLQRFADAESALWAQNTLGPLMESEMKALEKDLDGKLRVFLDELSAFRSALSLDEIRPRAGETPLEQVMSAVGGLEFKDIGGVPTTSPVSEVLREAGLHLALIAGLVVAGVGAPLIVASTVALGLIRTLWEGNAAKDRIRQQVAARMKDGFERSLPTVHYQLADRLEERMSTFRSRLSDALRIQVEEAASQVQRILEDRQKGEEAARIAMEQLGEQRQQLLDLGTHLATLRSQVAG